MLIVETANSTYAIDDQAGTVTRVFTMGGQLRRDGEPIEYLKVPEPVLGERMDMVLKLRTDGVFTYRSTSPVLRVVALLYDDPVSNDFYEEDEPVEDILRIVRGEEP